MLSHTSSACVPFIERQPIIVEGKPASHLSTPTPICLHLESAMLQRRDVGELVSAQLTSENIGQEKAVEPLPLEKATLIFDSKSKGEEYERSAGR